MDVVESLKACTLFEKFSDKGMTLISKITDRRELPSGTPLFVAGLPGESLFVVESGEIALELRVGDRMVPIGKMGAGRHFGQLSLLNPGTRLVGAAAAQDSVILEINRKSLLKLHSLKPQVSMKLMLAIVEDYAGQVRETAPILINLMA